MIRCYNIEFQKKSKVSVLSHGLLEKLLRTEKFKNIFIENSRIYYNRFEKQEIIKNSDYENLLLEESSLDFFPHEVCQIRLITKQHKIYQSPLFHGTEDRSVDLTTLEKWIHKLDAKARKDGFDIHKIQINHTHPTLEFVEFFDDQFEQLSLSLSSLSKADIHVGHKLSEFWAYPIQLKAITPSGHYFSRFV